MSESGSAVSRNVDAGIPVVGYAGIPVVGYPRIWQCWHCEAYIFKGLKALELAEELYIDTFASHLCCRGDPDSPWPADLRHEPTTLALLSADLRRVLEDTA